MTKDDVFSAFGEWRSYSELAWLSDDVIGVSRQTDPLLKKVRLGFQIHFQHFGSRAADFEGIGFITQCIYEEDVPHKFASTLNQVDNFVKFYVPENDSKRLIATLNIALPSPMWTQDLLRESYWNFDNGLLLIQLNQQNQSEREN